MSHLLNPFFLDRQTLILLSKSFSLISFLLLLTHLLHQLPKYQISRRETKPSRSQANIRQSPRNVSGLVLKSPEKLSNKSRGEPSHTTCTEAHSSKSAISRTQAVRRTPKVEVILWLIIIKLQILICTIIFIKLTNIS